MDQTDIATGASMWRVQLAYVSLGEIKYHLNNLYYYVDHILKMGLTQIIVPAKLLSEFLNIIITHHIDCFPTIADDLVLCAMTREEVEDDQETWRVVFDSDGLKINITETEYLPSPQMIQTPQ